jgi:hypothetical protein
MVIFTALMAATMLYGALPHLLRWVSWFLNPDVASPLRTKIRGKK